LSQTSVHYSIDEFIPVTYSSNLISQVCTTFLALSLVQEGYTVFANADASGTFNAQVAANANDRMRAAGVNVVSQFAISTDLMRDWRNTPGSLELLPFYDTYVLWMNIMMRAHRIFLAATSPSTASWHAAMPLR
jgi:hypothetical protein